MSLFFSYINAGWGESPEWGFKPYTAQERVLVFTQEKYEPELETKVIREVRKLHRQRYGLLSESENQTLSVRETRSTSVFLFGCGSAALETWGNSC